MDELESNARAWADAISAELHRSDAEIRKMDSATDGFSSAVSSAVSPQREIERGHWASAWVECCSVSFCRAKHVWPAR